MRFDSRKSAKGLLAGLCAVLALALGSCGGGGGGSSGSTTPPASSNVSLTISPTSAVVGFGGTEQFSASVSGSSNTGVTWNVSDGSGGTSGVGTISSAGLYTAPSATSAATPPAPQTVTVTAGHTASGVNVAVPELHPINSVVVTATSQADTTKSASATVTLSGLSILAVGQCPLAGGTCTAQVTGTKVARGATAQLFVAGYGIVSGTSYAISGSDVVVTQPTASNFATATDGTPVVYFQVVVSPTAALGLRNLVVTNGGGELAAFPGALQITP